MRPAGTAASRRRFASQTRTRSPFVSEPARSRAGTATPPSSCDGVVRQGSRDDVKRSSLVGAFDKRRAALPVRASTPRYRPGGSTERRDGRRSLYREPSVDALPLRARRTPMACAAVACCLHLRRSESALAYLRIRQVQGRRRASDPGEFPRCLRSHPLWMRGSRTSRPLPSSGRTAVRCRC